MIQNFKSPDELHEDSINELGNDLSFDAGIKYYHDSILDAIKREEDKLDDLDAEGHVWWNRFREFLIRHNEIKVTEISDNDF